MRVKWAWRKKQLILQYIFVVFTLSFFGPLVVDAATSSTTLTQQVLAGSLSISSGATASLSSVTESTSSQNATGNLGTVTVSDTRGTGVGWSATATCTNFTYINPAVVASGSNNTVTSGGTYNTATEGTYTITIATPGTAGTATFNVSGLETQTASVTGSNVAIGTHGVTATFAAATYVTGNSWTIRVDTNPVTNLTMTPSAVTTVSGSSTGVTAGSAHTFTSTSDAATIMSASLGNGQGSYSDNPSLSLSVPANSYADTYTATVTETVQ